MTKFAELTTREYNGIVELGEYLKDAPHMGIGNSSRDGGRRHSWDNGMDYDAALACALDGGWWEEGAEQMKQAQLKGAEFMNTIDAPEIEFDVTGRYLDMDEYIAGEPECWGTIEDQEQELRVIRVGFSAFMCADVPAKQAINRGAALLTVIDELEAQGNRVELVAGFHQKSSKEWTDGRILIKSANEHWSPSSVAFAMCHPAFSRRLGFRWLEAHPDTSHMTRGGYGHGMTNKEMDNTYDVYFDYFYKGPEWQTVDSAIRAVTKNFETYLSKEAA
jgi:hypothetical protein